MQTILNLQTMLLLLQQIILNYLLGQIYSEKIQVGDLRYNSDLGIFEGYSGGNVSFDGLYDNHRDTFMDPQVTIDLDLLQAMHIILC